jgi:autotransporter-associated beta strand protein
MQLATRQTQPIRSRTAHATAAPWRRSACLATLAIGLGGLVSTAKAELLLYEGFDYTAGTFPAPYSDQSGILTLNGANGGTGMTGNWTAANQDGTFVSPKGFAVNSASAGTKWNGVVSSVPQSGKYVGSPAPSGVVGSGFNGNNPDQMWAYRSIDPTVTASFTPGSTIWISYVEASQFNTNANSTGGMLAIGSGYFGTNGRGEFVTGGPLALGIGINYSTKRFTAAVWNNTNAGINAIGNSTNGTPFIADGTAQIGIAKIVWGDATTTNTTIEMAAFANGVTINQAAWDSASKVSNSVLIDPATVNKISLGGARFTADELRIGTTLDDVLGIVIAASGNYWAPGETGGGDGTWSSSSSVWSANPNSQGTGNQATTGLLIFSGAAGTVTIDGTVSAAAGIQFSTTDYNLVEGASGPNLNLTGADPATNVLDVATGTATISAAVAGSSGMTKDGSGTLVLSHISNTYGGGTMLNLGTLQIAALDSLGTGNVTFGGGTLQYASGASFDVSAKINAIASGQVAKIDTNGNDVSCGALSGDGSLTKLGEGSLTLAGDMSALTGAVTVSAGTLNVSSASGTIVTLNVPAGGTVNLDTNASVTTLNVTGGTVNIVGDGVQIATLVGTAGALDASLHTLTVTTSATLGGVTASLTGGPSFILSGANLVAPTAQSYTTVIATSGTLSFVATGIATAIGRGNTGVAATPSTATFNGDGSWTMSGGKAVQFIEYYGSDNHTFQYIPIPTGDFDIKCHVMNKADAQAGLMARDAMESSQYGGTANSVMISTRGVATSIGGVVTGISDYAPTDGSPYLRITRIGEVVTSYYSSNGITYTQAQQQDYTANPWGPTTYIGLEMNQINTSSSGVFASFNNVNFMGTATMPDLSCTELVLSGNAMANVECKLKLGQLIINTDVQSDGAYTAINTPSYITGNGAIIIGDNSATVTLGDLSHTYDGTAKAVTATPTPAGTAVNVTYNGSTTEPTQPGNYLVTATIDDPYYEGFAIGTLVLAKAQATVTLDNLSQSYDGNPKAVTATTSPEGLTVTFTYDGVATPPSAVGSYEVIATVNNDYYAGSDTQTLVIFTPAGYHFWKNDNALGQAADLDADHDGVPNGVEYFMGETGTSFTPHPTINNATNKVSWKKDPSAIATYQVKVSTDLQFWENAPEGSVTEIDGYVVCDVPGGTKHFVRLEVTIP